MKLDRVISFIDSYDRFLVTVHSNLDGDALGSQLAFARLLKKMGKQVVCVVSDEKIPYGYDFLPGIRSIRRYRKGLNLPRVDCATVLDCSDLGRTGAAAAFVHKGMPILNIDHHISNSRFGSVNWVEPAACCTCELVYHLYERLAIPVDRQAALLLYAGILTDTGSFRYSNTRPQTHIIAAELLKTGIRAADVYKRLYASVPYEDARLLSRILPTMQSAAGGKVIWFQLPQETLNKTPLSFDLSESILNFARSVKGVEVALLFKENGRREIRVNFRSQGKTDVNRLAQAFGGGGHRTAAGATVRGMSLSRVKARVLERVLQAVGG